MKWIGERECVCVIRVIQSSILLNFVLCACVRALIVYSLLKVLKLRENIVV